MNGQPCGILSRFCRNVGEPFRLDIFAAKADRQHRADIWVTNQCNQQINGILIVRTAVKPHQLHINVIRSSDDLLRHELGAFDRIDYQHAVSDPDASVCTEIALPS